MSTSLDKFYESFERFWFVYPRKVAKQEALREWLKIKPDDALADKIIEAVKMQVLGAVLKKDDQYTVHPARWLRGGRWDDIMNTDAQRLAAARKKRQVQEEQAELKLSDKKQQEIRKLMAKTIDNFGKAR